MTSRKVVRPTTTHLGGDSSVGGEEKVHHRWAMRLSSQLKPTTAAAAGGVMDELTSRQIFSLVNNIRHQRRKTRSFLLLAIVFSLIVLYWQSTKFVPNTYWVRHDSRFNHYIEDELQRRGFVRVYYPSESVHFVYTYNDFPSMSVLRRTASVTVHDGVVPIRHIIRSNASNLLTLKSNIAHTFKSFAQDNNLPDEAIDFLPKTWRMFDPIELEEFLGSLPCKSSPDRMWIFKKAHSAGGKNMFLMSDPVQIKKVFQRDDSEVDFNAGCDNQIEEDLAADLSMRRYGRIERMSTNDLVAQEYITNALLIEGHKFHIRAYWLLASMNPVYLLYFDSYIMKAVEKFESNSTKLLKHVTNNSVTEKSNATVAETHMNMSDFEAYLERKFDRKDFIQSEYIPQILKLGKISAEVLNAEFANQEDNTLLGKYQFLATDLVLTKDLKLKLIEWQRNPGMVAMVNNCDVLPWACEIGRTMAKEMLDILFAVQTPQRCENRENLLQGMHYKEVFDGSQQCLGSGIG